MEAVLWGIALLFVVLCSQLCLEHPRNLRASQNLPEYSFLWSVGSVHCFQAFPFANEREISKGF